MFFQGLITNPIPGNLERQLHHNNTRARVFVSNVEYFIRYRIAKSG
jgi:hypothetical protein